MSEVVRTPPPKLIFIRHGQTEWSKNGRYTSRTDLELTPYGIEQARATGKVLIQGSQSTLFNIDKVKHIYSSPRRRAVHTKELIFETADPEKMSKITFEIDEDLREWEYGDYEGLLTKEIIELRKKRGIADKIDSKTGKVVPWSIWADGCENGENHEDVTKRLQRFIDKVRVFHKEALDKEENCDVVVFAHGHILRALAALWLHRDLSQNPQMILDTSGIGVLSYQHFDINDPGINLSGPFWVPVEIPQGHAD